MKEQQRQRQQFEEQQRQQQQWEAEQVISCLLILEGIEIIFFFRSRDIIGWIFHDLFVFEILQENAKY